MKHKHLSLEERHYISIELKNKSSMNAIAKALKRSQLTFSYQNEHLKSIPHDLELEKDALAFVKVLDDLYNKKLFRSPSAICLPAPQQVFS